MFFNQVLVIFYLFFVFLMATSESFSTGVVFKTHQDISPIISDFFHFAASSMFTCVWVAHEGSLDLRWPFCRQSGLATGAGAMTLQSGAMTLQPLSFSILHAFIQSSNRELVYVHTMLLLDWKLIGWPNFHSGVRTRRLPPWVKP